MEIVLVLLVFAFLAYVIVKFLKKHWKTVLRWGAVLLAVFIGITVLPLFGTAGKVILAAALILCAVALLGPAVHRWVSYGSYPGWLERVGVGALADAPGSQRAHDRAAEHGYAESIGWEHVLSTKFRDKLLRRLEQRRVLTAEEFQKSCRSLAPKFRAEHTDILLDYLSDGSYLLELSADGPYLSQQMVSDCEHLLDHEGAATEAEFAEICGKSEAASGLYEERRQLAKAILTNMVRSGKADRVAHNAGVSGSDGGVLYVSKNQTADCRMTKREISLDD